MKIDKFNCSLASFKLFLNCASNCALIMKQIAEIITAKKGKNKKPKKGKTIIANNEAVPIEAVKFRAKLFFEIEINSDFFIMCLFVFVFNYMQI